MLDLSWNNLTGEVRNLKNFSLMEGLYLHNNNLSGSLTESIGLLSHLEELIIHSNFMNGVISDVHFLKLTKLSMLDISSNSFQLNFRSNWVPPFHLDILILRSCMVGPHFH